MSFFDTLESFLSEYGVEIIPTPNDLKKLLQIIIKYRLLPNDALIAATCKHHEINKIDTFDPDFERVDFLEIITPE
jgi:predicted nucleic acid-binding protein